MSVLASEGSEGHPVHQVSDEIGRWEWLPETEHLECDDRTARILGVDRARWVSRGRWLSLAHPGDEVRLRRAIASSRRAAAGATLDLMYRIIRPDGEERELLSRGRIHVEGAHGTRRVVGFLVDITGVASPAWQAEATLAGARDAIFDLDAEWRFSFVSPEAAQLTRQEASDVIGRVLWDVFPKLEPEHEALYRRAAAVRETVAFQTYYPDLGWFAVRAFPSVDGGLTIRFCNTDEERALTAERERLLVAERRARQVAEAAHRQLRHAAQHDALTGLPNRSALGQWLQVRLEERPTADVAVHFVDVDRFRVVNESLGHTCGDTLLFEVAARLSALTGDDGITARIGGDEFVIAHRCKDAADAVAFGHRILEAVREPLEVSGRRLVVTASVGLVLAATSPTVDGLLRDAELALSRAKDGGRDRAVLFDRALRGEAVERLALEQDLRVALDRQALTLAYQPNFDLKTGLPTGAEALARWQHPTRGAVPPDTFIPVAEATGLIVPLGFWALASVADRLRNARTRPDDIHPTVWVNVSGRQLAEPGFCEDVARIVSGAEGQMGIEITESLLLDAASGVHDVLRRLSAYGLKIAIDDFGTGYSGLGQLNRYPIDVVKIDRSFITNLRDQGTHAIVSAIIEVARAVGAYTVAEGVETPEELATLRALGCDQVCGYLLARPAPPEELREAMITGGRRLRASQPKPLPLAWSDPA